MASVQDIRMTPIEEVDLSVRAYNFCRRNGVDTIGDLIDLTISDVNSWVTRTGGTLGLRTFRQLAEAQEMVKNW